MPIYVMDAAEGAALRYQLDGMVNYLHRVAQEADDAKDEAVRRLVASLHGAREAADEIERRTPVDTPRRGVRLAKR